MGLIKTLFDKNNSWPLKIINALGVLAIVTGIISLLILPVFDSSFNSTRGLTIAEQLVVMLFALIFSNCTKLFDKHDALYLKLFNMVSVITMSTVACVAVSLIVDQGLDGVSESALAGDKFIDIYDLFYDFLGFAIATVLVNRKKYMRAAVQTSETANIVNFCRSVGLTWDLTWMFSNIKHYYKFNTYNEAMKYLCINVIIAIVLGKVLSVPTKTAKDTEPSDSEEKTNEKELKSDNGQIASAI